MSLLGDSPSGARPPRLEHPVWAIAGAGKDIIAKGCVLLMPGVPDYVLMVWWRGREDRQDVIPEASARAQVEAARARKRLVA